MHHIQTPAIVIVLQKGIRPQHLFGAALSKKTPTTKVLREDGHYLSPEMVEVRNWCIKHALQYSFNYYREYGKPFLDGEFLRINGDGVHEAIVDFPLPYIEVLSNDKINC